MDDSVKTDSETNDARKEAQLRYRAYFSDLFAKAAKTSTLDFVFTILRVGGMHHGHWDTLEESQDAFEDYNTILKDLENAGKQKAALRVALLFYCHLVEMSSLHDLLMNLIRCVGKKGFHVKPFIHKQRPITKNKIVVKIIPPGAGTKFSEIKNEAASIGDTDLSHIIDEIFVDNIRNAFSHSDYLLTDSDFRWTEPGPGQSIPLKSVYETIGKTFAFYEEFLLHIKAAKRDLSQDPRFHKMSNYEVLELIGKEDQLCGFKVHFSNGTCTHFERHREQVTANNFSFDKNGGLVLMAGNTDKLKPVWMVNGVAVTDFEALNKTPRQ